MTERYYFHERCQVWWERWHGVVKVGMAILWFCAGLAALMAAAFICDDYTEADLNRMAIDSLKTNMELQRLTEQKDALFNVQMQLERMGCRIIVVDSIGRIFPLIRGR